MSLEFIFLILTLLSARLTRLIFKDTLFDQPREAVVNALMDPVKIKRGRNGRRKKATADNLRQRHKVPFWVRQKIGYMITCPYCISAYATAVVLLGWRIFVDSFPAPVAWWGAAWMGVIVILEFTDGDVFRARKPPLWWMIAAGAVVGLLAGVALSG